MGAVGATYAYAYCTYRYCPCVLHEILAAAAQVTIQSILLVGDIYYMIILQ